MVNAEIKNYIRHNFIFEHDPIHYLCYGVNEYHYKDPFVFNDSFSGINAFGGNIIAVNKVPEQFWFPPEIVSKEISYSFPSYHILIDEIKNQSSIVVNYNIVYKKEGSLCINVYEPNEHMPEFLIIDKNKTYSIIDSKTFMKLFNIPEIRQKIIKPMQKGLVHKKQGTEKLRNYLQVHLARS